MNNGTRKLKAFVDLTRPVNVAITLASIPAASILAGAALSQWLQVVLAALTGGLVAAAANAINDRFDAEIDRINKPSRPIPRGDATPGEAYVAWLILSLLAIALNVFLNWYAIGIVVFSVIILYWYSAFFKRTVFAGNLVVGLMTGMAFIYGAVVVGGFAKAVVPAVFAFLVNVAREVIKDVEDVEGDRKDGAVTLPVRFGTRPALVVTTVVIFLLIVATFVPYQTRFYTSTYLYLVLLVDVLLATVMVWIWINASPANMNRLSNILKVCMVIGLFAIFFGSRP